MPETIEQIRERVKQAQNLYSENVVLIEAILQMNRKYVTRIPNKESVVALCSGGLDSIVMINSLIENNSAKVYPLFIKRGARAEKHEENSFDFFIDFYKKRFPSNIGDGFKLEYKVPPKEFKQYFPKELSLTQGLPLRNSTMQNLAVMYAVSLNGRYNLNIKTIFSASTGDDFIEPEQGLLSLRTQTLSTCVQLGDWDWQITSPFTDPNIISENSLGKDYHPIFKRDIIEYAMQNFIPVEKTRTCFSSDLVADGTCFACQKRLKAFRELNMEDPLEYKTREITI
ncbi:7-cyano-7-deazaguanine synthase [uncultured archaeon]|nr:7-cyano-7-deazaguanine synthase [uncultured archaeon]